MLRNKRRYFYRVIHARNIHLLSKKLKNATLQLWKPISTHRPFFTYTKSRLMRLEKNVVVRP